MKSKICIIQATYYPEISKMLFEGATRELIKKGIIDKNLDEFLDPKWQVPGIFELPIVIAKNIENYDAFIALGCVIKGKTPHFEFISKATINSIMNLSTKFIKPIGNGIITCLNKKQALERSNPTKKNKGGEAANAVIKLLKNLN